MKKIILMLVLALVAVSRASLIVYDSFDAATNSRTAGWAPAGWTATDLTLANANMYIRTNSLSVAGLKASAGNSLGLLNKTGDYYLDFNTVTLGVGSTIYFSFIEKYNVLPGSAATGAGGTIRLGNSVDGPSVAKGISIGRGQTVPADANNAGFIIGPNGTAVVSTPKTYEMLATHFIVGSYTRGATDTSGSLKLWINPDSATFGTANPPVPTLSMASVLSADTFDRLYIYSNGSQSWTTDWQFDEVRVATDWANVAPIPESATVGMLGLGALVTLLIRRLRG
jgi:hypothetical protein